VKFHPLGFDKIHHPDCVSVSMPRRLRYVPAGHPVEITQRIFQGRFLLRPARAVNQVVYGVLGRAVRKYQMAIHAFRTSLVGDSWVGEVCYCRTPPLLAWRSEGDGASRATDGLYSVCDNRLRHAS
jgi:hypothetical protein